MGSYYYRALLCTTEENEPTLLSLKKVTSLALAESNNETAAKEGESAIMKRLQKYLKIIINPTDI